MVLRPEIRPDDGLIRRVYAAPRTGRPEKVTGQTGHMGNLTTVPFHACAALVRLVRQQPQPAAPRHA